MDNSVEQTRSGSRVRAKRALLPVMMAVALLPAGAAGAAASAPNLEHRLRALEDRAEIGELTTSAYSKVIDTSDVRSLSGLFTRDGEYSSEWADIAAMPRVLSAVFARTGAWNGTDKMRARVTFRGRPTIANFMTLVVTARPRITTENGTVIATFDPSSASDAAPPPMPPPNDKNGAPPKGTAGPAFSMRHLVTNLSITLDGDHARATSYWTEISTSADGKQSVAGGGYYSDVLDREDGVWRFKQRLIHNYDQSPPGPAPGSTDAAAH